MKLYWSFNKDINSDSEKLLFLLCCGLTAVTVYSASSAWLKVSSLAILSNDVLSRLSLPGRLLLEYHYIGLLLPLVSVYCMAYVAMNWSRVKLKPYLIIIISAFVLMQSVYQFLQLTLQHIAPLN